MKDLNYRKYSILYVDDEEVGLEVFQRYFGTELTVLTAGKGEEALELIEHHPEIALVLTDQRMPGMTGVELLQKVAEKRPDIVRMLMTAFIDLKTLMDAVNFGQIYQCVEKPYEPLQLKQYLRSGIERYFLIQERDRLYSEKIKTMQKMARTNRLGAIGILAAGMAHEINNPLVAIQTFLEMAPQKKTEEDPDFWKRFHQVACKDVVRIRQIISELLSYSKNTGDSKLSLAGADLNLLIKETVSLLEKEAAKKNLSILTHLSREIPPVILDSEKIKQVVINLILNAIQATGEGTITITTEKFSDRLVQIMISDTGCGISEENLQKLFNPFFTTRQEGTGLGLMACHQFIDQHRGSIDVKSLLSKGTTFTLHLPLDPLKHDRRHPER
ncbi:MAG: response regulator [Nitrospirae bacterium]|nr:response regulator [Nitrospirota bacterium]